MNYIVAKRRPGDFLRSLLCNDLKGAVLCADDQNLALIKIYLQWFHNETYGLYGKDYYESNLSKST